MSNSRSPPSRSTSTGDTKATYGYTAYGKDDDSEFTGIDKPDAANPTKEAYNPYRYNAKRWDAASGTYDMGFRDYNPGLNRFTTRDMYNGALADMGLGTDPMTRNRYAFTGGNPTTFIEYDGHESCYPYAFCSGDSSQWDYDEPQYEGWEDDTDQIVDDWIANENEAAIPEKFMDYLGARDRARVVAWNAGLQDVSTTIEQLDQYVTPTMNTLEVFADARKKFKEWEKSDNQTLKRMGERGTAFFESTKAAKWVGGAADTKWFKGAGKVYAGLGAIGSFIDEVLGGEDLITAGGKALLTGGLTAGGAAVGAEAGLACGPLAPVCVPAGAAGGGWIGTEVGGLADSKLEEWGFWEWTDGLTKHD
jgi:RHS repeat-associated protein